MKHMRFYDFTLKPNLAASGLSILNLTGCFMFSVACHGLGRDRMTLVFSHSMPCLSMHVVCKFQLAGSYRSHAGVSYAKEACASARDMTF